MDFLSSLAKGGGDHSKPASEHRTNPHEQPSNPTDDLLSSAKVVVEEAEAQFFNTKGRPAFNTGNPDETKGVGKSPDQAGGVEEYHPQLKVELETPAAPDFGKPPRNLDKLVNYVVYEDISTQFEGPGSGDRVLRSRIGKAEENKESDEQPSNPADLLSSAKVVVEEAEDQFFNTKGRPAFDTGNLDETKGVGNSADQVGGVDYHPQLKVELETPAAPDFGKPPPNLDKLVNYVVYEDPKTTFERPGSGDRVLRSRIGKAEENKEVGNN